MSGKISEKIKKITDTLKARAAERKKRIRREIELKRLKRIRKKKVPAYRNCKNCGTELQGMYCHNCGQYALDVEQPFWKYVLQYFENVYQFDGKIWATLSLLIRKPGFLTNEFNAGKIASYVHPMKMLMFITVLFFMFFFIYINNVADNALADTGEELVDGIDPSEAGLAGTGFQKDSCIAIVAKYDEVSSYSGLIEIKEHIKGASADKDTMLISIPAEYVPEMNCTEAGTWRGVPLVERASMPEGSKAKAREAEKRTLFKDKMIGTASSYAPIIALLLTPVLALLLMWFYRKSRMGYMGHFVFSLHLASYFYIVLSIYIIASELWKSAGLLTYLFCLIMFFYTVIASHRVYKGTGWIKAGIKTILLFSIYIFIVSLTVGALAAWLIYTAVESMPDTLSVL